MGRSQVQIFGAGREGEVGEGPAASSASLLGERGLGKGTVQWIKGLILDHEGQDVTERILHSPQVKQLQAWGQPQARRRAPMLRALHLTLQDTGPRGPSPTCISQRGRDPHTERKGPETGQETKNHILRMTCKKWRGKCCECTLVAKSQIQVF